jgi:hypothetical protein
LQLKPFKLRSLIVGCYSNCSFCVFIQEFYDVFMASDEGEPAGLMTALQTAVTSIALLWSLRAGRNITALPFALSVDTDYEGWFGAPVLYQSPV